MKKRSYSWSNSASIGSTLAAGFNTLRRAYSTYGRYFTGPQKMVRSKFRFRRGGSRTKTKRRRFKRRRVSTRRRISRIWKYMRNKGLRNVETKYLQNRGLADSSAKDTDGRHIGSLNETVAGNPPDPVDFGDYRIHFTDITQGDRHDQREGDKIFIKNVKFRAMLQANTLADTANEVYVRFLVVRVKEGLMFDPTTGSTSPPHIKMIYEFIGDTGDLNEPVTFNGRSAFINTWKYYNSIYSKYFTVLKNKVVKISKETGADFEKKLIKFNIRVNQPCTWSQNSPQNGHIYIYWYCDGIRQDGVLPIESGLRPSIAWTYRVTYTDV